MSTATIWQTVTTSSAGTERLGESLSKLIKPPLAIELKSDLGGGKTTFVRGLARGFGSKDVVASPTFTLSKIYQGRAGAIHHFDFYRLNDPGVVADQLVESLADPKVITVVEWSDIVKGVLPDDRLVIELAPTQNSEDERQITISYPEALAKIIERVETEQASRP